MGTRPGGRRARNRAWNVPDRRLSSGNQERDTNGGHWPAVGTESRFTKARSAERLLRGIGGVCRYATGDPGVGDPNHVACLFRVILIEHEKDVDRDGFRGPQGERVAWIERSQATVDARLDEEGGLACHVFWQLAPQLICARRE